MKFIYFISFLFTVFFSISCKQLKISDADRSFRKGEYFEAANRYRKLYQKTSPKERAKRGEIAYRLGESYRLLNYVPKATVAYANTIRYNPTDTIVRLQYARTLHKNGEYTKAAEQYSLFLDYQPQNKFAQNGLKGTKLAKIYRDNPSLYKVKKINIFNSKRGEFSPMLLPPDYSMIYLTSHRDESDGDEKSLITGTKYNDIFVSRKDEKGNWMKPESAGVINTMFDEGVPSFSASGNIMYYTLCKHDAEMQKTARIYKAIRVGGEWGKGTELRYKEDSLTLMAHPAISPSANFLYFVSDMPGGYGGKDIWRAALIGDDIDYIENMGPTINTAGDEMFPYMRNDSTLYFASDGHPGMGGLDIFEAKYNSNLKKWEIANMQYPINSQADDFGITFYGEVEKGFFSSNRDNAKGEDHIYEFEYPQIKVKVEGYIVDKDDNFVLEATIRVVGNDGTNEKFRGTRDGTYQMELNGGANYVFLANATGFLNSKQELKTIQMERDSTYYVDFVLYAINKPAVLENIFYDFDKAALRDESKKELDDLIELLEINPNITIELSAHTDRKGSDSYNLLLSKRRAQSVVDYLIAHKIKKERLVVAGYGKSKPKVITKSIAKKYNFFKEGDVLTESYVLELDDSQREVADQLNRRTEFKVLSTNYNLK